MQRTRLAAIALIFFSAASIASLIFYFTSDHKSNQNTERSLQSGGAQAPSDRQLNIDSGALAPPNSTSYADSSGTTTTTGSADIPLILRNSVDFRKFYTDMLGRPEVGGITYAAYAASLCRVASNVVESTGTNWGASDLPYTNPEDPRTYQIRNDSFHKIKAACQSFSSFEISTDHDIELTERAKSNNDSVRKIAEMARSAINSGSLEQRKIALADVLESGDPLLLSTTLENLILVRSGEGLAYWYDGKLISASNSNSFRSAISVLPCRLGLICDERSPDVVQACIGQGGCYKSRIDLARSQLSVSEQVDFDKFLIRLEQIILERRVEGFFKD